MSARLCVWLGVAALGVACLAGGHGAPAQPVGAAWGMTDLMGEMARVQSASGRFTERKTSHLLKAPLLASGTLRYVAPDYLAKLTVTPVRQGFVLDHGEAAVSGADGQTRVIEMAGNPQIAGLTEAIRATLAGDLPALDRLYTRRLTGTDGNWRLELRPRDAELAHFVTWIVILGAQDRVTAIDTASGNGDHSEMGVAEDTLDAR